MEIIPRLSKNQRRQCDIEIYPYLRDHCFDGKIILPAVEALIVLARAVKINYPMMEINCLRNAIFSRLLIISPDSECQPVFVDMENSNQGGILASLLTLVKSKTGTISRTVEHARVEFTAADYKEFCPPPFRTVSKLKGDCISIPSATIYRELVPFGKSFQNIIGDLSVSSEGALAYISGGNGEADEDLLGSPFPMDAVMHAACVWGQRFAGTIPFPVGFRKRVIYQKTKKGEEYLGRVMPLKINKDSLVFDAWIYDKGDKIYESIEGIEMKDVSGGRLKPPEWILVDSG
ncbi:MAG: polyketide synthase dehydratase domain-containing protein [Syntrophaceae bacterium]|nr:polyketide synthase dehydratase domain-containing protein [Syntrophaceae bacterium]